MNRLPCRTVHAGPCASMQRQTGAAALVVTLMLFFAILLTALFVNRNLVFEQRSSANQYRATQAFEAAEAGIEWAAAQLNANQRIGADCEPGNKPGDGSFRARYLGFNMAALTASTATITPLTWLQSSTSMPLMPSCSRVGNRWSCSCPAHGLPVLTAPSDTVPSPAFTISFLPVVGKPGLVKVSATGCSSLGGPCSPGSAGKTDTSAHAEVLLGMVQGLRTPPPAAVTARGGFLAAAAAVGLHNPDPASGIALHAGGQVVAANARWSGPAGTPLSAALASGDATLAALDAKHLFARHFGLDKAAWQHQPAVTRLSCSGDCSAQLHDAVNQAADAVLLWVDGDLILTGPLALGSHAKPVLIVAEGSVRIDGAVAITGLLYAAELHWRGGSGGILRGAVIVEGDVTCDSAADFFYDVDVLARFNGATGSFVRVSGSWRDG